MADWASAAPEYGQNNKSKRKSSKIRKKDSLAKRRTSWTRSWKPAPTDQQGAVFGIESLPPAAASDDDETKEEYSDFTVPTLTGLDMDNNDFLTSFYGRNDRASKNESVTIATSPGHHLSNSSSSSSSSKSSLNEAIDNIVPQLLTYNDGEVPAVTERSTNDAFTSPDSETSSDSSMSDVEENELNINKEDKEKEHFVETEEIHKENKSYEIEKEEDSSHYTNCDAKELQANEAQLENTSDNIPIITSELSPSHESIASNNSVEPMKSSSISNVSEISNALSVKEETPYLPSINVTSHVNETSHETYGETQYSETAHDSSINDVTSNFTIIDQSINVNNINVASEHTNIIFSVEPKPTTPSDEVKNIELTLLESNESYLDNVATPLDTNEPKTEKTNSMVEIIAPPTEAIVVQAEVLSSPQKTDNNFPIFEKENSQENDVAILDVETSSQEVLTETSQQEAKSNEHLTSPSDNDDDTTPLIEDTAISIEDTKAAEPPSQPLVIEPWIYTTYQGVFNDFEEVIEGKKEGNNISETTEIEETEWKKHFNSARGRLVQCLKFCDRGYDIHARKLEESVDYRKVKPSKNLSISAPENPSTENKEAITPQEINHQESFIPPHNQKNSDIGISQSAKTASTDIPLSNDTTKNVKRPKTTEAVETQFIVFEELNNIRSIGVNGIKRGLSNIYTNTPFGGIARHIAVYGGLLFTFIFFILAIISFSNTQDEKRCNKGGSSPSCNQNTNVLGVFEILFGLIGLLFTSYDAITHTNRSLQKCVCPNKNLTECIKNKLSPGPGSHRSQKMLTKAEFAQKTVCMAAHCTCCPKKVVIIMDIIRMFIMDAMFYPALVLSIFSLCAEIALVGKGSTATWFLAVIGFLGDFLTVYVARAFILLGSIYSIARIRNIEMTYRQVLKASLFQITFVAYSLGNMFLQITLIMAMGSMFYDQYSKTCVNPPTMSTSSHTTSLTTNRDSNMGIAPTPTSTPKPNRTCSDSKLTVFDVNYKPDFQLIFLFLYGFLMPVIGTVMFFIVHKFWTSKLPIDVISDVIGTFSNPPEVSQFLSKEDREEFKENMKKTAENVVKNLAGYKEKIKKLKSTKLLDQILYPISSPKPVILCFLHIILLMMCIGFVLEGLGTAGSTGDDKKFDSNSQTAAYMLIPFCLLGIPVAIIINFYAFSVVYFWLCLIISIVWGIINAFIVFVAVCLFCTCTTNRTGRRYYRN